MRTLLVPLLISCALSASAVAERLPYGTDTARLHAGARHIVATQESNGLFRYDFDFVKNAPTGEQSITRQAGTAFALAEYLQHHGEGDARLAASVQSAVAALARRSLPVGRHSRQSWLESLGVLAIDSQRLHRWLDRAGWMYAKEGPGLLVSQSEHYDDARSGATALTIAAAVLLQEATGRPILDETLQAWLEGLWVLRMPDAGFRFTPLDVSEQDFFNGEGWLAYALASAARPDDAELAERLASLDAYILRRYGAEPATLFYHWGAMTSAERYRVTQDARFADFIAQQSAFLLDQRPPMEGAAHNGCALVEGLSSAYWVLDRHGGHPAVAARVRERALHEIRAFRTLQVVPGQKRLSFAEDCYLETPALAAEAGAFLAGSHEPWIRTDLTQHCISALSKSLRYGVLD